MSREVKHGTANEYMNYGCRCDKCRAAWAIYHREQVRGTCPMCDGPLSNKYVHKLCKTCHDALRTAPHGTESRYTYQKCRCDLCRQAANRARRERRYANPEVRLRENRKRLERYHAAKSEGAAPK